MSSVMIDTDKLKKLIAEDEAVLRLCEYFSQRLNDARISKVDRLVNVVENVGRYDVIRALKHFDALGAGTFMAGRKGYPSRFEWQVSSMEFAQAAINPEQNGVYKVSPTASEGDDFEEDEYIDAPVEHSYKLRHDFNALLNLPADLTAKEAERLAAYVLTLPIGH